MAQEGGNQNGEPHSHPSVSVKPADVVVVPNDKLVFSLTPEGEDGKAKAHLVIHNPTDEDIIYKFRSNATGSASVGVHPCGGHVHPGEHADINVVLDYEAEADIKDLKVLIVTAPSPKGDFDMKTAWAEMKADQQKTTKIVCVVSTDPNSQHKSCFISKVPTPPGPPAGSQPHHSAAKSNGNKEKEAPKPSPKKEPGSQHQSARPPSARPPSAQPSPQAKSSQKEEHLSQLQNPLPKASMFTGFQRQSSQMPRQGPQSRQHQPARNQPIEGGNRGGTQKTQQGNPANQGKKPTSYFVDVSSVASPEMKSAGATTGFFGMDMKSMMQAALLMAAGIAATKLFLE